MVSWEDGEFGVCMVLVAVSEFVSLDEEPALGCQALPGYLAGVKFKMGDGILKQGGRIGSSSYSWPQPGAWLTWGVRHEQSSSRRF